MVDCLSITHIILFKEMKAIKIDVKQTWVDVPHGIYREAVHERMRVAIENNENLPTENAMFKEVTYFPIKVYEPGNFLGGPTTYLIKQDDRKVFTDLLTIQTQTLNDVIAMEVQEKWEAKHYEIEAKALERFRELPWYKRLFI